MFRDLQNDERNTNSRNESSQPPKITPSICSFNLSESSLNETPKEHTDETDLVNGDWLVRIMEEATA